MADETAREMARLVWERYGSKIEADATHLKNVQGQHGVALANMQDQLNRVQNVQGQQGRMLEAIMRHMGIDIDETGKDAHADHR